MMKSQSDRSMMWSVCMYVVETGRTNLFLRGRMMDGTEVEEDDEVGVHEV